MTSVQMPLGEVADVFNGKTPAASEQRGSGHPVLKIKDVLDDGTFCGAFDSFVDEDFVRRFESKQLREGDTLILNAAHNADYVGSKRYYANTEVAGAIATGEWLIVRANKGKAHSSYVWHWLQAPSTRFKLKKLVKGIHLYPRDVQRLAIPLPPLTEQQRIAAILDKADAIRRKRQQAIQLADEFLCSVFREMFGDPITNNKNWPSRSLGDICRVIRGSSPRPKGDPRYYGGPIPRLMVEDITRDGWFVTPRVDSLTQEGARLSRPVPKGTLVMVVSGNVGVMARLNVDACIHDGFAGLMDINADAALPDYLMCVLTYLKETHSKREAGAIFKNLTTDQIREMKIPVPPVVEQRIFEQIFSRQRTLRVQLDEVTKRNELFASLSQRAFRGEL